MNLTLEKNEVELVLSCLSEIPYKISANLIAKIVKQIAEQAAEQP